MHKQDVYCSPASLLASFFSRDENKVLVLVTGPSGSGKTNWCLELARLARSRGISPAGLISPPIFFEGQKVGFELVDLASEERRRLAVRHLSTTSRDASQDLFSTDDWQFDPEVLAWGDKTLAQIVSCDLLILDELGPLEFSRGQGLRAGLRLVDKRKYHLACVVIRPMLLPAAQERWPWGQVLDVSLKPAAALKE